MNTATIDLSTLGIKELDKCLAAGKATIKEVFDIVEARINKRIAAKRPLLKPVVEYRNSLATSLDSIGHSVSLIPEPTYAAKASAALPTDPEQLADVVFATVGAANVGAVITRLTARVVGS